jgi:hypothetical protein
MAKGAVVVYLSRLGGRLRCDQKIMLDANAQLIAPAARGVSPMGDHLSDERHSVVIDEHRVVVRAAEPVGVARGLSTLIRS